MFFSLSFSSNCIEFLLRCNLKNLNVASYYSWESSEIDIKNCIRCQAKWERSQGNVRESSPNFVREFWVWQPCENDASSFVAATFFLCKDYCIFLIFHETLLSLNLLQQRFILFKDDFTFWIFIVCAIYVRMYLCMCVCMYRSSRIT